MSQDAGNCYYCWQEKLALFVMTVTESRNLSESYSPRPKTYVSIEFACVVLGVLFSTFTAFRHPTLLFTVSDFFFCLAFVFRPLHSTLPLKFLGAGTALWLGGLLLLIFGLLMSSMIHGDPTRAVIVIAQYSFAYILLPFVLLGRTFRQALILATMTVWSTALNCLAGLIAYVSGYSSGNTRHFMLVSGNDRVAGLVDNPNGLAGLIVLSLPILWMLGYTRNLSRITFFILFAIYVSALVLTSSNSGLVGALLCGVLFLLFLGNYRLALATIVLGAVAVFAVMAWGEHFLPRTFQDRVLAPVQTGDFESAGTLQDRLALMREAWAFLPDNIIIGMGVDQYREMSSHHLPVHNTYLLLGNEGGMTSLMGYLMLLLAPIVAVACARDAPNGRIYLAVTVSVVLTLAALAMGYAHVYQRAHVIPILLSVGLAIPLATSRATFFARRNTST